MPKGVRILRRAVPGPDTGGLILVIDYEDMAAYGARTAFENANANAQWGKLFEAKIGLAGEVGFGGVVDGGDAIDSHIS
jgi:hypothetical protein